MEKQLKFCYRLDAVADFAIGVRVLIPALLHRQAYSYPVGIVAAVGLSWGILLLAAAGKPLERIWILGPTILVISLISIVYLHALISNGISLRTGIISTLSGSAILAVNVYVLHNHKKRESTSVQEV
jgi:hypothetical protein